MRREWCVLLRSDVESDEYCAVRREWCVVSGEWWVVSGAWRVPSGEYVAACWRDSSERCAHAIVTWPQHAMPRAASERTASAVTSSAATPATQSSRHIGDGAKGLQC